MSEESKNSDSRRPPSKPNVSEVRRKKLKEYLSKYNERDLRFMYFRSTKCPSIVITSVSILNRDKSELTVAFSFCSPKDSFCKAEGKIKCFEKLELDTHEHKIAVPWREDGLLAVGDAYNHIDKPEKLKKSRFDSLISKDPVYHVIQSYIGCK